MVNVKAFIRLFKGPMVRQTAFESGYRPLFRFIREMNTSGEIILIDRTEFYPGDEGLVNIRFVNRQYLGESFSTGTRFSFSEGGEVLGDGEIIEIN